MTVPIFICHSAEDAAAYDYLVRHLRPLVNNKRARVCSSRSVLPGEPRAARIRREIHEARLILFLVSANLVASDDIESVELPESLARAEVARLIPIIVSDCLWQHTRLGHLNAIPRERGRLRAVSSFSDPDTAWNAVVVELDRVLEEIEREDAAMAGPRPQSTIPVPEPVKLAHAPRPADAAGERPGAADLDGLLAKVNEALRRAPALAAALAARGYGRADAAGPAADIAGALVETAANQVATDLAELAREPAHRDAARDLLWHILPLAGEWDDVVDQATATSRGRDSLELVLRTETVAEIVLARLESRRCLFAPVGDYPEGIAHVPLPSVAYTSLFDLKGEALRDAVLSNLYRERSVEEPWRRIKKDSVDEREFLDEAAAEINTTTLRGVRPYLLAIDAKFRNPSAEDQDACWEVVQGALCKALPGLRLVRLKGPKHPDESVLRILIKRLHDLS